MTLASSYHSGRGEGRSGKVRPAYAPRGVRRIGRDGIHFLPKIRLACALGMVPQSKYTILEQGRGEVTPDDLSIITSYQRSLTTFAIVGQFPIAQRPCKETHYQRYTYAIAVDIKPLVLVVA